MTEMKDLATGLMKALQKQIEDFNEDFKQFKRSSAVKFQEALIVLCFCFLGGQRKQVITDMNIKVEMLCLIMVEVQSNS